MAKSNDTMHEALNRTEKDLVRVYNRLCNMCDTLGTAPAIDSDMREEMMELRNKLAPMTHTLDDMINRIHRAANSHKHDTLTGVLYVNQNR